MGKRNNLLGNPIEKKIGLKIIWRNRRSIEPQTRLRQEFHMNGVNFEKLVALVQPNLEKQDPNLRKSIPIEKRVGAALWRLASGNSFRSVAKTLAIGKSSSVKITHDFCDEIVRISSNLIKFPQVIVIVKFHRLSVR